MKKNISINISGIIFHIEEDGYELLKNYLESINQYFASFDDNHEIIADIESRMAEIFLAKLTDNKQVIGKEDVEALQATMGSVKDFQAIEEAEAEENTTSQAKSKKTKSESKASKTLVRDSNRKVLGGVAAGIAHYFGIDPLWTRLLFVILTPPTAGFTLLLYILLWIVLPESDAIKNDKSTKKMFRNPDNKVLGGVANGVAAYFAIEVAIVRILFVALAFTSIGIILYILLWIILPEANSITEKVQMKGDPITLTNIESNIKKDLNVGENDEENVLVKILLFPFRVIGMIFSGLGKFLGPLMLFIVEAARIFFGVVLALLGLSLIFTFVVTTGLLLGIFAGGSFFGLDPMHGDIPLLLFSDSVSAMTILSAFFATSIPTLFMMVLGISIIAKRNLLNATVGWSLLAIWVLSLVGVTATVPAVIYQFKENGEYRETESYQFDNKTVVLKINEIGNDNYSAVQLKLRGHEKNDFKLIKEFESQGRSRKAAIENAKMVGYHMEIMDSIMIFDSNITFSEDTKFRGQDLEMTLYIPYNTPFKMDYGLRHIIHNTIYRGGYRVYDMGEENTWIFTPAGLECITCEKDLSSYEKSHYNYGSHSRVFDNKDFASIEIGSAFETEIEYAEEYKLTVVGREEDVDDVLISQEGNHLMIDYAHEDYSINNRTRNDVKIRITLPLLEQLNLSGATEANVSGFKGEKINIVLTGASSCELDADFSSVEAEVKGASELELSGQGEELVATVTGASKIYASSYMVKFAKAKTTGMSTANLYVTEQLQLDASAVSKVKYRGGATLVEQNNNNDSE